MNNGCAEESGRNSPRKSYHYDLTWIPEEQPIIEAADDDGDEYFVCLISVVFVCAVED